MKSLQRSLLVLFIAIFALPVGAKELTNRLGVGYSDQFAEDANSRSLPSLTVRYWPSNELGVSAALGVDTLEDSSKFGFMAKLYRIIFTETNMNFYMGTGAGIISEDKTDSTGNVSNESGFELNGFVGAEFFITGLDSLSFSFEAGIGVTSIDSEVRFRTIGQHPLKAGIIFYF